jgi:hypothetical protein
VRCFRSEGLLQWILARFQVLVIALLAMHPFSQSKTPVHTGKRSTQASECIASVGRRDTGFRVRILTRQGYSRGDLTQARSAWSVNTRTILLMFDPSAPNVFAYDYIGDDILLGPLRRPFWIELQSRYGNLFYVRENVRRCPLLPCSLLGMRSSNARRH